MSNLHRNYRMLGTIITIAFFFNANVPDKGKERSFSRLLQNTLKCLCDLGQRIKVTFFQGYHPTFLIGHKYSGFSRLKYVSPSV